MKGPCRQNTENEENHQHGNLRDREWRLRLGRCCILENRNFCESLSNAHEDEQIDAGSDARGVDPPPRPGIMCKISREDRRRQDDERDHAHHMWRQKTVERKAEPGCAGCDRQNDEKRREPLRHTCAEKTEQRRDAGSDRSEADQTMYGRVSIGEHGTSPNPGSSLNARDHSTNAKDAPIRDGGPRSIWPGEKTVPAQNARVAIAIFYKNRNNPGGSYSRAAFEGTLRNMRQKWTPISERGLSRPRRVRSRRPVINGWRTTRRMWTGMRGWSRCRCSACWRGPRRNTVTRPAPISWAGRSPMPKSIRWRTRSRQGCRSTALARAWMSAFCCRIRRPRSSSITAFWKPAARS